MRGKETNRILSIVYPTCPTGDVRMKGIFTSYFEKSVMSNNKNSHMVTLSQNLRRNMTKEERHLWYDFLKGLPIQVKRQVVLGRYIVDFFCPKRSLIIELDGSQHYEQRGLEHDLERDDYLVSLGMVLLRYTNRDINTRFDSVCQDIWNHIYN